MKIIVDAFGGDNAPLEILKGCAEAVNELDIDILLTGSEAEIRRVANENNISLNRMEIADTPDVITMEDHAGDILKEKSNSSMALGLKLLAEGKGDGFRVFGRFAIKNTLHFHARCLCCILSEQARALSNLIIFLLIDMNCTEWGQASL